MISGSRPTREATYLGIASLIGQRSTCLRRKVGCVLTDADGVILSLGYNGVAPGEPHCNEGHPCSAWDAPSGHDLDGCQAIHAEQNALLRLADLKRVEVCWSTTAPCVTCTKLLLATSCKFVVFLEDYARSGKAIWEKAGRVWVFNPGAIETVRGG